MGSLYDKRAGRRITLRVRHLVGRSRACDLRLSDPSISGEHATLLWRDGGWVVRDLGSRNGTWVRGVRVEPGALVPVNRGDALTFGAVEGWVLEGDASPKPRAVPLGGGDPVEAMEGVLALPDEADPQFVLESCDDGRWVSDGRTWEDLEEVEVGGRRWRLMLPVEAPQTAEVRALGLSLLTATLRFKVSANEESVELEVRDAYASVSLPERSHWYTLLVLGRERARDQESTPGERGWVDRDLLQRMLGIGRKHVNVHLHRARRALSDAGVLDVDQLVERRGTEVRLGTDAVEEIPLG